ncbi:unnamed protein product [Echinostoma caproni]|uniref:PB1 domain-containing protein n=1 Tax=Echinostoma caproni TaxID=27848 RepID=A0A183AZJ0_9TREM|nr:unnamed protein product [Echinostoma caproni]
MTARVVKFKYGSDIRRRVMERRIINFVELNRLVHELYKDRISVNMDLKFKYIDGGWLILTYNCLKDGDMVTVTNDTDLRLALESVANIKFLVYPSYCHEDSDPCAAFKKNFSLSQLEAVSIAQQLVVMRALLLKIIDRIASENKTSVAVPPKPTFDETIPPGLLAEDTYIYPESQNEINLTGTQRPLSPEPPFERTIQPPSEHTADLTQLFTLQSQNMDQLATSDSIRPKQTEHSGLLHLAKEDPPMPPNVSGSPVLIASKQADFPDVGTHPVLPTDKESVPHSQYVLTNQHLVDRNKKQMPEVAISWNPQSLVIHNH